MMSFRNEQNEPPIHIDQQVDLLEYLDAILRSKYRLLLAAIFAAASVFGLSKLVDDKFTATGVAAVNINENPGGVAPESYRGSDALGLLEHDFIIDVAPSNEIDRLLSRLGGYEFTKFFIDKYNLLPLLFPNEWNDKTESFEEGFKPDYRVATKIFREEHVGHSLDEKSGLLKVYATTHSADFSAEIVNNYLIAFNEFIKMRSVDTMNSRRAYLERRLNEVSNIEVQRSIYRLLEAQLGVESMIHARESYPFELIQPANPPLYKSYPSRKKWAVLAFVGIIFLGMFFVIGLVLLKKMRIALAEYKLRSERTKIVNTISENVQESVISDWVDK